MIFGHFLRDLYKRLPEWDRSARLSLYLAVILLIALLLAGFVGPDEIKLPARLGAFGLLLTLQLLILWANRRAISPYHEAQQHYIRGEYESARDLLEPALDSHRGSADALALLGNCYRQLGQFDRAELAIERALQTKPDYHYALYAAGKLNLVLGDYAQASELIERACSMGAPEVVYFDLGQAYYYLRDHARAAAYLGRFCKLSFEEPAKTMLAMHYLKTLTDSQPASAELIRESIIYWQEEAARYRRTGYGTAILNEVRLLQGTADGSVPPKSPSAAANRPDALADKQ
ncbi:MAG: tetratricopeptide repeat protein [Chloroflexi bacterium]|nr:tetratricopeptide repeat protein [Chloroflexota bacterium]